MTAPVHRYEGECPDPTQPAARDAHCPACQMIPPVVDDDTVERVALAIFNVHNTTGQATFGGRPREVSLDAARAALTALGLPTGGSA